MPRYDHKVTSAPAEGLQDALAAMGGAGWELVAVVGHGDPSLAPSKIVGGGRVAATFSLFWKRPMT